MWLKTIPYIPNDITNAKIKGSHQVILDYRKKLKSDSINEARRLAVSDIGNFSKRDLFMLGLGIYMGEGSKTVGLRLANSDPSIIKIGITWFKKTYDLTDENFIVRINLYPDCNIGESIKYWSDITGLKLSQFYPVYVDRRLNKKIRNTRKLLFGTAHVTILSGNKRQFGILLRRRILSSIEILGNKAGLV